MILADLTWDSGLPKTVMDIADVTAKFVVIVGGLLAALKAIKEIGESRKQRAQDLRWKRASMARELVKEIHADPRAMAAIEILDWGPGRHEYVHREHAEIRIGEADVVAALEKPRPSATGKKDEFIWESFDWLFYHLDRLEHYIGTKLITFRDVRGIFRHYAKEIEKHRVLFDQLIKAQDYSLAGAFLDRFKQDQVEKAVG